MRTSLGKLFSLIIIMIFTTTPCCYATFFSDVTTEHKNYNAIHSMSEKKIVNGYDDGSFKPDNSVTRAELCVIIARASGYKKNSENYKEELPFDDVANGYWAEDYIKFAYNKGIVNGMGDGTFLPAGSVTYEQAVKMLVCFVSLDDEAKKMSGAKWYTGYLEVAYEKGLLENIELKVTKNAKRSDIVQILHNAYENNFVGDLAQKEYDDEDRLDDKAEVADDKSIVHKEIRKILVDAGHNYSGFDIGARAEDETIKEEIITWQISDKLADKLEDFGFEVYVTRLKKTSSIGNTSVLDSLQSRVDMAHELGVDLFLSIHCNIGGGTGVETYCFNKESVGGFISGIICDSISDATDLYNRGAKTADYYVIKNTAMPSVLVETGFMDSEYDVEILTSKSGQDKIAKAIADALKYYNEVYKDLNKK